MNRIFRCLIVAALPVALTACKGEQKAAENTAGGQILPGSVSDAMLPLDTVRSQPPLAPKTESAGKPDKTQSSARPAPSDPAAPEPSSSAAPAEVPVAPPGE